MQDTFSNTFPTLKVTLFYGGHLGFFLPTFLKPVLQYYLMTTDEADGSEVLGELYVALFRECNNCYQVNILVHKPV